jgi:hypothetical protein
MKKYGPKALSRNLVHETWKRMLKDKNNLPKDWLEASGVLVGIPNPPDRSESHTMDDPS